MENLLSNKGLGEAAVCHVRSGRGRFFPCVAIRAGWKITAAASVVTSDSAISLPMLEVPGWCESHRLPKAIPVVDALNTIARVSGDCRNLVSPPRHATM